MSSPSASASECSSPGPATPPNLHQNTINPEAKWLVQKFGGTSVGKFAVKIAQDVVSNYIDTYKVAIVCSARSGSTKTLGTTNLLLQAASEALNKPLPKPTNSGTITPISRGLFSSSFTSPERRRSSGSSSPSKGSSLFGFTPLDDERESETIPAFQKTVDLIKQEHISAARSTITSPSILSQLEAEIHLDCEWLSNFLLAARIIDEISPRSRDSIVGLGERLACKYMTAVLRDQGLDAEYVSLEDIVLPWTCTTSNAGGTPTLPQEFYDTLASTLGSHISSISPRIPVITGFFGPTPGSLLHQVGRGYTDLCSALLSVGLDAAELQIWKEVDGIFTADPRKVSTARLIRRISPAEAAELTFFGSEVVHPFTMEQAIRRRVPVRIKNVQRPEGEGTVILPEPVEDVEGEPSNSNDGSPNGLDTQQQSMFSRKRRLPTAVTIKENILILNINSNRKSVSHGFLSSIFSTLDKFGITVDLISTSEVQVSMAISAASLLIPSTSPSPSSPSSSLRFSSSSTSSKPSPSPTPLLSSLLTHLSPLGSLTLHPHMSILSLVGRSMKNNIGIAGQMFKTLASGGVNIEMISQGASEINISCVVREEEAVKAVNLIHLRCLGGELGEGGEGGVGTRGRVGPWLF